MAIPILKQKFKTFYTYEEGSLEMSVVGYPTDFYVNYEDQNTSLQSSDWIKGNSGLFHTLTKCTNKDETIRTLKSTWEANLK